MNNESTRSTAARLAAGGQAATRSSARLLPWLLGATACGIALAAAAAVPAFMQAWVPGAAALLGTVLAAGACRHQTRTLRRAETRYLALVEHCPDAILVLDASGRIERVNPALTALSGHRAEELLGAGLACLVPPRFSDHAARMQAYLARPAVRYMDAGRELWLQHRDGHEVPVEISLAPAGAGHDACVVVAVRDLRARQAAARALAASERRLRDITNAVPGAVYQFERRADGAQRFTFLSEGMRTLLELAPTDPPLDLNRFGDFVLHEDLPGVFSSIDAAACNAAPWTHEFRVRTRTGGLRWLRGHSLPCPPDEHGTREWNGILVDVSETRALAAQLAHQALYDSLTDLPNRRAFEQRLAERLAQATGDQEVVVAFLDLDQFKVINDTCGHAAGDELLRQVAAVLKSSLRQDDALARLGGDEFAMILSGGLELAERVLHRVREAIADLHFSWEGKTFSLGISAGVVAAQGERDVAELLRRADAACYGAKDAGRNCVRVFREDDAQASALHGQMRWVPLITDAIQSNRLELYVQPIVALGAGAVAPPHYEVLLRMRLAAGDLAPPGAFLPAAERYNLAPRLDRWVVARLFEQVERWPRVSGACPVFNVNLSGLSLGDADTTAFIIEQFRRRAVPSAAICFEITETAAIARLSLARAFIAELKALGCRFALDDFGSGISSFGQLKNLDIDFVKIDGMFVRDIARDQVDRVMVTAINDMAHALGIATVAEFVEDDEVLGLVRDIGIDYAQGYAIGRPRPLEQELSWVTRPLAADGGGTRRLTRAR